MIKQCGAVISNDYLPGSRVAPEVGEGALEPRVDLVQRQLSIWRLDDGLKKKKKCCLSQSPDKCEAMNRDKLHVLWRETNVKEKNHYSEDVAY